MATRQALAGLAQCLRQRPVYESALESLQYGGVTGARNAATLASVKMRIKSVQNIKKITSAMKMVAASKMRKAQANQEQSVGMPIAFLKLFGEHTNLPVRKTVNVPLSSDKGMCGGINSTVAKLANACTLVDMEDKERSVTLLPVGSKGATPLRRNRPGQLEGIVSDYSKNTISFALVKVQQNERIIFVQASSVAEEVLKTDYDSVRLLYNSFKSAISFKPTICTVLSPETLEKSDVIADKFDQYELEGPSRAELLQDLAEFQLASMMFYAMNEACTSEHASRMQAMESSTKNSTEMLEKLTLTFNRSRQAKITTELNEIISGALSLEEGG